MIIHSENLDPHPVEDYDITFSNGFAMTITIDKEAGDEVDHVTDPTALTFKLSEKPSPTNAKDKLPSEDIIIYKQHVLLVQHRERLVTPVASEVKDEFQRTIHKMSEKTH